MQYILVTSAIIEVNPYGIRLFRRVPHILVTALIKATAFMTAAVVNPKARDSRVATIMTPISILLVLLTIVCVATPLFIRPYYLQC